MGKFEAAGMMIDQQLVMRDVIEHDGERLIVMQWFSNPALGLKRPEHVIPLASVPHHDMKSDPNFPYRWGIEGVFPKSLTDGTATPAERERYGLRKGPEITMPLASSLH